MCLLKNVFRDIRVPKNGNKKIKLNQFVVLIYVERDKKYGTVPFSVPLVQHKHINNTIKHIINLHINYIQCYM